MSRASPPSLALAASSPSSSSPSIQRDTSFRTALKNQKRRLSATKAPTPAGLQQSAKQTLETTLKPVTAARRGGNNGIEEDEEKEPVAVEQTCPDPVNVNKEKEEEPRKPVRKTMPALQLASSPYLPRTPSPLVQEEGSQLSPKPLQQQQQPPPLKGTKSPIPPGSPLLCKRRDPPSPTAKKCREFNRELRRARSFRKSMERSRESSRNRDLATSEDEAGEEDQVSFCIRQHMRGKQGWIIMPESGSLRPDALQRVVGMIKQMELSGHTIPERITIKA